MDHNYTILTEYWKWLNKKEHSMEPFELCYDKYDL